MMGANENVTEKIDIGVAFSPIEFQNLIFRLKYVSDSI